MKLAAFLLVFLTLFGLEKHATTANMYSENTFEKRVEGDILSEDSCRYLKERGYDRKDARWEKLCLKTFKCNDTPGLGCEVLKEKNKCSSAVGQQFCKFTCGNCGKKTTEPPPTTPAETTQRPIPTTKETTTKPRPTTPVAPHCKTSIALGMQSNAIPDSQITASSTYDINMKPSYARLNKVLGYGGWAPAKSELKQEGWLQVDLGQLSTIDGIATQGQGSDQAYNTMVETYSLQYSLDGATFKDYEAGKIFAGNSDVETVVKHALEPAVRARYIRLVVKSFPEWPVLRMELYGCK